MALEPLLTKEREQRREEQNRLVAGRLEKMTSTAWLVGSGSLSAEKFHLRIAYLKSVNPKIIQTAGLSKYFNSVEESVEAQHRENCLTAFIELYRQLYVICHRLQDTGEIPAKAMMPFHAS